MAREIAWLVETIAAESTPSEVVFFIDDNPELQGTVVNGIPIVSLQDAWKRCPTARIVGGVGAPDIRQAMMERAATTGFETTTLIHPRVEMSRHVDIGEGTVICAGNIITTNIRIGRQVQLNNDCTIAHDTVLEDYATLAPGVHISGGVVLGERCYLGTGVTVIDGSIDEPLVIGHDAIIGAGACVTRSLEPGVVAVGVPAKVIKRREGF